MFSDGDCEGFVNDKRYTPSRIDDDYSYYNDYEVMKARRDGSRRRRPNTAAEWRRAAAQSINVQSPLAATFFLILIISTIQTAASAS